MTDFTSLFENCGKFYLPGRQPLGNPLDPITPPSYEPVPADVQNEPPLKPSDPPVGEPLYRCEDVEVIRCDPPFQNLIKRIRRQCVPCLDGVGNHVTSVSPSPNGFADCSYKSPTCDDEGAPPCEDFVDQCPNVP